MGMYQEAQQRYAQIGVDTEAALEALQRIAISIHCWQGDDVTGFEQREGGLSGGIATTGNYPGKARNADELRRDLDKMLSFIGGRHRISLHASYAETGSDRVERDALEPKHFAAWLDWAKERDLGLDFNPTLFSHPKAEGLTLSSADEEIRQFWIRHCIASRRIADWLGRELGEPAVTNLWIPDGFKDDPIDRYAPRRRLADSLDTIFHDETPYNLDAVESKVFGIGAESATIGSHEFYMGYAVKHQKLLTLDTGHFHPTEYVSDKITAVIDYVPGILLHVSRPVRWDSDHVVILDNELIKIMQEIRRHDLFDRVHIGLDFFDASINRIAAWVIGIRSTQKALLLALLEPSDEMKRAELSGDFTTRLAMLEQMKTMPWSAVWDEFCSRCCVAPEDAWLRDVKAYEREVLAQRR